MSLPAVEEEEEAEVEDPLEDVAAAPLLDEASLPLKEDMLVSPPFLCSDSDFAALKSLCNVSVQKSTSTDRRQRASKTAGWRLFSNQSKVLNAGERSQKQSKQQGKGYLCVKGDERDAEDGQQGSGTTSR